MLGARQSAALTPALRVLQVRTEAFVLPGAQGTDRHVTSHPAGVTPALRGTGVPQSTGLPQLHRGKRGNPSPSLSCGDARDATVPTLFPSAAVAAAAASPQCRTAWAATRVAVPAPCPLPSDAHPCPGAEGNAFRLGLLGLRQY